MYYSQHGEDFLLDQFFDRSTGYFVDVGAFDGVHLSNSFCFEQAGWKGVCVEPSPRYFDLLKANRPRSHCVQAVCAAQNTETAILHEDQTGLLSTMNWSDEAIASARLACERRGIEFSEPVRTTVPAMTLNSILEQCDATSTIDFLSLDVEGLELEVLEGFDIARYRPAVIVVETRTPEAESAVHERLTAHEYVFSRRLSVNSFYTTSVDAANRLREISLDVVLPRNPHPLGDEFTHPEQRQDQIVLGGVRHSLTELLELKRGYNELNRTVERFQELKRQHDELEKLVGTLRSTKRELDALGLDANGIRELKRRHDQLARLAEELKPSKRALDALGLDPASLRELKRRHDALAKLAEALKPSKRALDALDLDPESLKELKRRHDRLQAERERFHDLRAIIDEHALTPSALREALAELARLKQSGRSDEHL